MSNKAEKEDQLYGYLLFLGCGGVEGLCKNWEDPGRGVGQLLFG